MAVLQFPQKYDKQAYSNAQQYIDTFIRHNVGNVHEFFEMFAQLGGSQQSQEVTMQKFWVLNSIEAILKMPEYETQVQQATDGQKMKVHVVHQGFMSFLVNSNRDPATGEHLVFSQSIIANKFALIFVRLACRDFPQYWNTQFSDLFSLLQQPSIDQKYRLQLISKFPFSI